MKDKTIGEGNKEPRLEMKSKNKRKDNEQENYNSKREDLEEEDQREDEREKPLLTKGKRQKVVRFLISPKKKKVKIEVNERKELKKIRK